MESLKQISERYNEVGKLKTKITDLLVNSYILYLSASCFAHYWTSFLSFYTLKEECKCFSCSKLGYYWPTPDSYHGHAGLVAVGAYSYGIMCTILGLLLLLP